MRAVVVIGLKAEEFEEFGDVFGTEDEEIFLGYEEIIFVALLTPSVGRYLLDIRKNLGDARSVFVIIAPSYQDLKGFEIGRRMLDELVNDDFEGIILSVEYFAGESLDGMSRAIANILSDVLK